MRLPTIYLSPDNRSYITSRHITESASGLGGETFLYAQERGLGHSLVSVPDGFVMISFRAEMGEFEQDVHMTLARGRKKSNSLCCPRCGREARRLYFAPFQCAICHRIDERIFDALIYSVTHKPTPEEIEERERKEAERWASLSDEEREAELQVRADVEKWIEENGED